MKGKRLAAFCMAFALTVVCFITPASRSYALYNDEKYDTYQNMSLENSAGHARYVVPNLYRQDAAYTNVKTFPLVVSGGVEYFPLDIFALYSYLEVVYGKLSYGFYINNTKNNHYVAFDLNTGTTTTYDNQILDIKAELFYRTYYVPAKTVCEILGLKFESYDNPEAGIRAARVSDSRAKYTMEEIVALYSPSGSPQNPDVTDSPPLSGEFENQPVVPEKPDQNDPVTPPVHDPYEKTAARGLYLTFDNLPDARTPKLLDLLEKHGAKAIFFVEKEKILDYPDTVRRMIADGHTVGLYVSPTDADGTLLSVQALADRLADAGKALELVTKRSARYVRIASGYEEALSQSGAGKALHELGYTLYDYNVFAKDGTGYAQTAFEALKTALFDTSANLPRTYYIRFGSYNATNAVVEQLLEFCDNYRQFQFMPSDDFCTPPAFLKMR